MIVFWGANSSVIRLLAFRTTVVWVILGHRGCCCCRLIDATVVVYRLICPIIFIVKELKHDYNVSAAINW